MAHLRRSLEYALLILDHIPAMPLRLLDPPSCTPHEHAASISLQKKSNRRLWKDDAGYSLFPVQSAAELRQRSEASIICTLRRLPTAHSPPPPRTCARLSAAAVDFRHNVSRSFAFGASAARASHICSGTRPAAATSAPGLGPPLSHICSGTGPTPPTSAPGLGAPLLHLSHICSGTRPTALTSAPGLGPPLCHICLGAAHRQPELFLRRIAVGRSAAWCMRTHAAHASSPWNQSSRRIRAKIEVRCAAATCPRRPAKHTVRSCSLNAAL